MFDEETGKETGAIGIPLRNGDRTDWYSAEKIHHLIQIAEQGTSGEPPQPPRTSRAQQSTPQALVASRDFAPDQRVMELQQLQGWEESPAYFLQALPPDPSQELRGFYGTNGIAYALLRPSSLRPSGFNLSGLGLGEWLEGALVLRRMDDAAAWLDPNGMFTTGVGASPDYLGWALNPGWSPGDPMKINSTALVEFTLEFCRFVHHTLMPHKTTSEWEYRLLCLRFKDSDVRLGRGVPGSSFLDMVATQQATSNRWEKYVTAPDAPGSDALRLLAHFYGLFALGEDDIPYRKDNSIDEDAIRNLT